MYERYDIPTREAPPARALPNKFHPKVGRLGLAKTLLREVFHCFTAPQGAKPSSRKELLLSRPCIYGVFSGPLGGFAPRRQLCVGCMRCVQEYPQFCEVGIDERWKALGDGYFGPEAVTTLDYEATTGKIPVKGVGYKGPFTGEGFDGMWTDMSEIVRPTRDGIYGREFISTVVDVGRKPVYLKPGKGLSLPDPVVELPVPFLFDSLPGGLYRGDVALASRTAAERVRTFALVPAGRLAYAEADPSAIRSVIPWFVGQAAPPSPFPDFPVLELEDANPQDFIRWREAFPRAVLMLRMALDGEAPRKVLELAAAGAGTFHLTADYHGRCADGSFVGEAVRRLHDALVEANVREELTLVVSGGIVRAEHVPKVILCGADLVALDTPLWVALGASLQPFRIPRVDPEWGTQRIVNFCAAWRDQLLEILSAMGLREVRRLRGELGRAMFFQELEREAFGDLQEACG